MSEAASEAKNAEIVEYIAGLVAKGRAAQAIAEGFSQEQVDRLTTAIGWAYCKEPTPTEIAKLAVEETGMGRVDSKHAKMLNKVKGTLVDMKGAKTVGEMERDEERGIVKYAKPVGVVGCITPITNCEATPAIQIMAAVKTRNAIIVAPHPRARKLGAMIVNVAREVLKKMEAPEDLVQVVESASVEASAELMRQVDLVFATGGTQMVKAAYSSGTPAYGVGAGNAVVIVAEDADIEDVADKVMRSKTFDNATSCSTENSLVIHESIYDKVIAALKAQGGYLCDPEEKAKLGKQLFRAKPVNPRMMAQPVEKIASIAGLNPPEGTKFFMVEETGVGPEYPFSGEKLSLVITIYKYKEFAEALDLIKRITAYQGTGHSCGIHTFNEDYIRQVGEKINVSRIMVRQPQCLANSGAWTNGMPITMSLSCGTWGNNISTNNITWREFLNVTWLSYPIPSYQPSDEEIFGEFYNT